MNFSNIEVLVPDLPLVELINFNSLEKDYLRVQRLTFFITFSIVGIVLNGVVLIFEKLQTSWIIMLFVTGFLLVALLVWFGDTLSFKYSGYALRQKDVLYRSGWFIQKVRMVPLSRIQHVSVQSGPIERKYKLASVSIFTAGLAQADFTIRGITDGTANQLKEGITELMHGNEASA
ncbi:MAG: PH domain-containing protein [Chitinophagaceae bacterium]|nr:PH domain-containing protein [Chitinophagaceae bacterium]